MVAYFSVTVVVAFVNSSGPRQDGRGKPAGISLTLAELLICRRKGRGKFNPGNSQVLSKPPK